MAEERGINVAKAVAAAITALAVSSCTLSDATWLEVHVGGYYREPIFEKEWPWGSGEHVTMNNSLTDSAGLAGLEIEVLTPDSRSITLTSASFDADNDAERISVGESGTVSVFVRLLQNDVVVAEGHTSWTLGSWGKGWTVLVERAPFPFGADLNDLENPEPRCDVPWCHKIRRVTIREDVRNYPDESLWLEVDRRGGWEG